MTDSPIRLSPSGPVIGKIATPGPGARIRLYRGDEHDGRLAGHPVCP